MENTPQSLHPTQTTHESVIPVPQTRQVDEITYPKISPPLPTQAEPGNAFPASPNDRFTEQIDLVRECGDTNAFWEIAVGFRPLLVDVARYRMRRYSGWLRVSAEDVADDAIIKIYERLERVRAEDGYKEYPSPNMGYFVRAVYNVINDCAKQAHTRKSEPQGELVVASEGQTQWRDNLEETTPDVYAQYDRKAIAVEALRAIVGGLTSKQRQAALEYLASVAYGGNNPEETQAIAAQYGMTVNALKAMVYRVRQRGRGLHRDGKITLPDDLD